MPPEVEQSIPKGINKGDPVLYMLQRIDKKTILLVDYMVTSKNRQYEKILHDLFKDRAFRMTKRTRPPGIFSRHQVKFGISSNLAQRIADINADPSESGVTEWRRLSNAEMAIAHNLIWQFKYGRIVWFLAVLGFLGFWVWLYLMR